MVEETAVAATWVMVEEEIAVTGELEVHDQNDAKMVWSALAVVCLTVQWAAPALVQVQGPTPVPILSSAPSLDEMSCLPATA